MTGIRSKLLFVRRAGRKLRKVESKLQASARGAVDQTSRRTQKVLRREVDNIFSGGSFRQRKLGRRGRRVGGAVRRKMFDNRARGSAAIIYSKFGRRQGGQFVDYLGPYLTGRDIKPRNARFLTVPLTRVAKRKGPGGIKGLAPVRSGNRLYLVKSTRTRSIFHFMLLPRVPIRKRLRAGAILRREGRAMAARTGRSFRSGVI